MTSTDSPTRRSTSARVRTVVVFPVPPLRERTAIVSAMRGRDCSEKAGAYSPTAAGAAELPEPTVAVSKKWIVWRPMAISSPSLSGAQSTRAPLT